MSTLRVRNPVRLDLSKFKVEVMKVYMTTHWNLFHELETLKVKGIDILSL